MPEPVFILAPPRSFTSVICAMIGQHPQAYGMPDLNLFNCEKLIDLWQPSYGDIKFNGINRHGLLRAIAEIYTGQQNDESIECALHWCAVREKFSAADVFKELVQKISPLILVDKSPSYALDLKSLHRINEAYPYARFIHLTRHPVTQCESAMQFNNGILPLSINSIEYQYDKAIIEPQIAWHDININILNFLEGYIPQERYIRVRAEDLIGNDAELNLAGICHFLGISDDAESIEEMMHPENSPYALLGPINALYGNDPKFLRGAKLNKNKGKIIPLDSPISWRRDINGLCEEVINLAIEFGYK